MKLWYGIEGVEFLYHGDWSDPTIKHENMEVNSFIVEDTMYERWKEEGSKGQFEDYMIDNADDVIELIQLAYESPNN